MADLKPLTTNSPTSEIFICKDVPFGRDYASTILFTSWDAQREFFRGRAKYVSNAMKPFTLGEPIRVQYPAEQMYECNYIYFTSQTSRRHWSAFITNIKRVNENVADIYYEIDVLQSWQLKWKLNSCMVLREHVNNDAIGENLQPEPIDTGDYVLNPNTVTYTGAFQNKSVCVIEVSETTLRDDCKGGIYQASTMPHFQMDVQGNVAGIVDYLQDKYANPDSIVAIFMFPTDFIPYTLQAYTRSIEVNIQQATHGSTVDGYTPRNNKLFTYPFNFMYVTNSDGNAAIWRYEWFSDPNNMVAHVTCPYAPNAQAVCVPWNYGGKTGGNYDEKIVMQPFPQCSWLTDTYRAYLAQNGVSIQNSVASGVLQTVGGAVATVAGLTTGTVPLALGGVGAIASGMGTIGNTLQDKRNHEAQPVQAKGNVASDTMFSIGDTAKDFTFVNKCVQADYARAIDSFFDIYGYAVNRVKVPNITGRPSWNYVKTENCQITGEIALGDIEKLNTIFNRGVTFWHGDFVGDYSRSNK